MSHCSTECGGSTETPVVTTTTPTQQTDSTTVTPVVTTTTIKSTEIATVTPSVTTTTQRTTTTPKVRRYFLDKALSHFGKAKNLWSTNLFFLLTFFWFSFLNLVIETRGSQSLALWRQGPDSTGSWQCGAPDSVWAWGLVTCPFCPSLCDQDQRRKRENFFDWPASVLALKLSSEMPFRHHSRSCWQAAERKWKFHETEIVTKQYHDTKNGIEIS